MTTAIKKLPGNTIELILTVSWSEIQTSYNSIFEQLIKEIELPGFRKGKVPREMAAKQIKKTSVYEEVLKNIVPKLYADAVKQEQIKPIISPKIEVIQAEENKDWQLKILTCEEPTIDLGSYQKAIQDLKAAKTRKIWVPGQKKEDQKPQEPNLDEILEVLAKEIKVEFSPLMLDQETNRLLSNLVNELQKLGMTVEQYLQAQGKTADQLKNDYAQQANKTLALEFALEKIADKENVIVSDQEINDIISKAKTPEEKQQLEKQRYYLGSLLRRQKTISQLLHPSLVNTS